MVYEAETLSEQASRRREEIAAAVDSTTERVIIIGVIRMWGRAKPAASRRQPALLTNAIIISASRYNYTVC